jgi:hypothetical protein
MPLKSFREIETQLTGLSRKEQYVRLHTFQP